MIRSLDRKIIYCIQYKLYNPVLEKIMKVLTIMGNYSIIWIFIMLVLYVVGEKKWSFFMLSCMLVTNVVNNVFIKAVVRRDRPFEVYDDIERLIPNPYGSSFPSGHSANAFSCATLLLHISLPIGILATILACGISFSRLYLRVHFFTDILGGAVIGVLCTFAVLAFYW